MDSRSCPKCGGGFAVTNSRSSKDDGVITRRTIVCLSCGEKYITHEKIVGSADGFNDTSQKKAAEFLRKVDELVRSIYGDSAAQLRSTARPSMLKRGVPDWHVKSSKKSGSA